MFFRKKVCFFDFWKKHICFFHFGNYVFLKKIITHAAPIAADDIMYHNNPMEEAYGVAGSGGGGGGGGGGGDERANYANTRPTSERSVVSVA